MPATLAIDVPKTALEEFCRRNHIHKLSFFGSVTRDDFGSESDVDVLVEYDPKHVPSLLDLAGMEIELSDLLGHRKVDLLTPGFFKPSSLERIQRDAVVHYVAAK